MAIISISAKIGCTSQTLNEWVKKAQGDAGKRADVPTDMAAELKAPGAGELGTSASQRDPAQGIGLFVPGGPRLQVQAMIAFIDDHRERMGIWR